MSLQDPNVVNSARKKRVAIVIANPARSTTTGWPVGFWWSELTHSYYLLSEAGYEIEVFSPNGGRCNADALSDPRDPSGYSAGDLITMGFIATRPARPSSRTQDRSPISMSTTSTRSSSPVDRRRCSRSIPLRRCTRSSSSSTSAGNSRSHCAMGWRSSRTPGSRTATISPRARPSPGSRTLKKTSPTAPCGR